MYFESRYFWMVFTFVGDSTTTSERLATVTPRPAVPPRARPRRGHRPPRRSRRVLRSRGRTGGRTVYARVLRSRGRPGGPKRGPPRAPSPGSTRPFPSRLRRAGARGVGG